MHRSISELLNFENPVLKSFVFWSVLLLLKVLATAMVTSFQRFKNLTFANPEDAVLKNSKVKFDNVDVERVRRAHRNDLENVFILILTGFLYALTDPAPFFAINLFRASVIARFVHTFVYAIYIVPQPARAIAFFVPFLASVYMGVVTLLHVM